MHAGRRVEAAEKEVPARPSLNWVTLPDLYVMPKLLAGRFTVSTCWLSGSFSR